MKKRHGFVSNSSSSSFIVKKKYLTELQKRALDNIDAVVKKVKNRYEYEEYLQNRWSQFEHKTHYEFSTDMDNFPLFTFLTQLGIPCAWDYEPEAGDFDLEEIMGDIDEL